MDETSARDGAGPDWIGSTISPSGSARLVATRTASQFMASPLGRCLVGRSFLAWCHAPDLLGVIVWGTVDDHAEEDLRTIGRIALHPALAPRRRVLVDCRAVERVDPALMITLGRATRDRQDAWADAIERQAVVVPAGLPGLLIAGVLPLAGVVHPVCVTQDVHEALAFLAHPAAACAYSLADRLVAITTRRSELLARLRTLLSRDLVGADVEGISAMLGMSTRSFQRELSHLETSFRSELLRARLSAAEALLVHTDLKIDAIAVQTGFGTGSRLCTVLRQELDVTPNDLRTRVRAAQPSGAR